MGTHLGVCYGSFLKFLRASFGMRELGTLVVWHEHSSSLHQSLLGSVHLESVQSSCLSSPFTYQSCGLYSLTFLFSGFTAFPTLGHLAIQKALKKAFQIRRCLTGLLWLVVFRLCLVPGVKQGSGVRSNSSTTH